MTTPHARQVGLFEPNGAPGYPLKRVYGGSVWDMGAQRVAGDNREFGQVYLALAVWVRLELDKLLGELIKARINDDWLYRGFGYIGCPRKKNLTEGFSCEREIAVHFLPDTRQLTCIFARILKMRAQLKMSGNLV